VGYEVSFKGAGMSGAALLASALLATPVALADEEAYRAVRPELFASSDADGSEVLRAGVGFDTWRRDREHWRGLKVEHARFAGEGWSANERRVYLRAAGTFGTGEVDDDTWRWRVSPGSNGDRLLGSAALNTEGPRRREVFVEREILETRQGVDRGQVFTFLGAAVDQPVGEHGSLTGLVGLQDFDDGNLRTHLRGTAVYAARPEEGLSVQLRTRWYRNSRPFQGDYFSPDWYAEAIPAIGWRRFHGGHMVNVVAGAGRQRNAGESWRQARLLQVGYETPRWWRGILRVTAGYTDTPVATSDGQGSYSYRFVMLESVVPF